MAHAHPIFYSTPRRDSKSDVKLALPRDAEASTHLRITLHRMGYDFGESILNFPQGQCGFDLLPDELVTPVELSFVKRGDVVVKATRPPLSDGFHGDSKRIEPSNTSVERAIFRQYWRYMTICSRSHIRFTPEAAAFLPKDKKDRGDMCFFQQTASYKELKTLDGKRALRLPRGNTTAAFVFRCEEVWAGGPGLVAAWSMNAIATVGFCNLLRFRCPELLENRGLTMVELDMTDPPTRPTTYEWTRNWRVTPVFDTKGELPPPIASPSTRVAVSL